eukprot:g11607.t1 g11607   contig6:202092-202493(+)
MTETHGWSRYQRRTECPNVTLRVFLPQTDTVDVGEVTTADPKQNAEEDKGTDGGSKHPRLSKLGSAVSWNGLVGEIGNIDEDDDDFFAGETIIPDFGKQSTDSKLAGSITLGNLSLSEFNFDPDDMIDRNGRA